MVWWEQARQQGSAAERPQRRLGLQKQQLDGRTAAIMNPIEGEQEAGGTAFRGVRKAIITVPLFCVCVRACVLTHARTPGQLKQGISQRMELRMALGIAFRGAGVCHRRRTGLHRHSLKNHFTFAVVVIMSWRGEGEVLKLKTK